MSVYISSDGQYIVSGSVDRTIRVSRLVDGTNVTTITGHTDQVLSVCVSPDGQYIISGSGDRTIRVWRFVDGTHVTTITGHTDQVSSVSVSPDGQYIISGSGDRIIRMTPLMEMDQEQQQQQQEPRGRGRSRNARISRRIRDHMSSRASVRAARLLHPPPRQVASQTAQRHYHFFPDTDDRGKPYLEVFLSILKDWRSVATELPYDIKLKANQVSITVVSIEMSLVIY